MSKTNPKAPKQRIETSSSRGFPLIYVDLCYLWAICIHRHKRLILGLVFAIFPVFIFAESAAKDPPTMSDWPMWAGRADRNLVAEAKGLPATWDIEKSVNIKWSATLGTQTYGNPAIVGGKVFIGTNNGKPRDPKLTGDKGVLMCFDQRDGKFLWQAVYEKLPEKEARDWPDIGVTSTPCIVGDRAYYVSNRGELVCVDTEGFHDGDNDGPLTSESRTEKTDADLVWTFDMLGELGVIPLHASASAPLVMDDLVFAMTANGSDPAEGKVPAPAAPSFVAVDRHTGKLAWKDASPGKNILAGQWSSPAGATIGSVAQVVFPGGDGWLYSFEPKSGKLIWKFNCKSNETVTDGVPESINYMVASPVIHGNRVFIAVGQDPESGDGDGCLWAIDATRTGDITATGAVWRRERRDFGRTISTVAIKDNRLYAAELSGYLQCIDAATGKQHWKHDLMGATWSSPVVADGKVYMGNEDGTVIVFKDSTEKELLSKNEMNDAMHGTVAIADDTLFIVAGQKLYAIASRLTTQSP